MRALLLSHIYSGDVAFTAAVLFTTVAALDVAGYTTNRRLGSLVRVTFLLALALALLSGTPLRMWALLPLAITTCLYGGLLVTDSRSRYRRLSAVAMIVMTLVAAIGELPYRLSRPSELSSFSRLVVVGDSLASGGFGESRRWIDLLSARTGIEVVDRTRAGLHANEAVADVFELQPATDAAVLFVIGGNDMLAGRSSSEFGEAMTRSIAVASARGYQPVFVMELPVLPGRWGYGARQRRIARKHDAVLIPKRVLVTVLSRPGNTSDGIHLTQRGHEAMASELAPWLGLD